VTNTTVQRVRAIAEHLKNMDMDSLQIFIDDAILEVDDCDIPDKYKERAQRLLTAHMATLNKRRGTSKSASDLSITYGGQFGMGLYATSYGQEFDRLLKKIRGVHLRVM